MPKNTGKPTEKLFEDHWKSLGKTAYCHRFVDASEIRGRTGKIADSARAAPSDYIVVHQGTTSFCEVKSTTDKTAFRFNLLRPSQSAAARMIQSAGGAYLVFIHSLVTDQWFRVPHSVIEQWGRASMTWSDLQEFSWTPNSLT